jgi:gluconolactonase
MQAQLTVYNERIKEVVHTDIQIEVLDSTCLFTEGPVWSKEGYYLFSDIPANVIYSLAPGKAKEVFLEASGCYHPADPLLKPGQEGSNALAFTSGGELLICQHGNHAIAKYTKNRLEPFISQYNHLPLNSPNDLVIHSNGKVFFSDPPYGLKEGKLNPDRFQPLAGVYCWDDGDLRLICDKYQYPNGVVLSPDEKILYICSNKPFESFISAYDAETYVFLNVFANETSDGIEMDPQGHVYLCNKDGIIILDKEGKRSALISLPSQPANCCWGSEKGKDLFITARHNVILIRNLLR